ncbi:TPA: hypothetical protein DEB04_03905 [Candidatus Giovannonibacteria bacterium]|nr:hypothetical protein [Candidatus Giovannonibacteria bacterium]
MNKNKNGLIQDVVIIAASVAVAIILARTDILTNVLTSSQKLELAGSFIAGLFFTSIFTVAPAAVTLGEIAQANSVILTALFGALGAVAGDLIIFKFMRDRFSRHLMKLIKTGNHGKRLMVLFKLRSFRWLTFFAGGFIIASPLPDELGIALLGFSKLKTSLFVPLSFTFNFLGICLIGIAASLF